MLTCQRDGTLETDFRFPAASGGDLSAISNLPGLCHAIRENNWLRQRGRPEVGKFIEAAKTNRYGQRDAPMILVALLARLAGLLRPCDLEWSAIDFTAAELHVSRHGAIADAVQEFLAGLTSDFTIGAVVGILAQQICASISAGSGQYVERALPDLDGGFELFDSCGLPDSPEARS